MKDCKTTEPDISGMGNTGYVFSVTGETAHYEVTLKRNNIYPRSTFIYSCLIYIIMNFNEAWKRIVIYAKSQKYVETLVKNVRNDICYVNSSLIVVESSSPNNTPTKRELKRDDFELAWNILESTGSVSSEDISPIMIGKRLIILALMARALNLRYSTKPVTIYL